MSFLIADAVASVGAVNATTSQTMHGDGNFSLVMVVVIFVLFYFMLIRPQNKRAKEHRELIGKIKIGDEIILASGLLGKVAQVDDLYIKVSVAEGVEVNVQRNAVSAVLPKGTIKSL